MNLRTIIIFALLVLSLIHIFFPGKILQVGCKFCVPAKKQGFILFGIQPAIAPQFVNQMLHINGQRANTSLFSLPTPASAGAFRQLFHYANMAR